MLSLFTMYFYDKDSRQLIENNSKVRSIVWISWNKKTDDKFLIHLFRIYVHTKPDQKTLAFTNFILYFDIEEPFRGKSCSFWWVSKTKELEGDLCWMINLISYININGFTILCCWFLPLSLSLSLSLSLKDDLVRQRPKFGEFYNTIVAMFC